MIIKIKLLLTFTLLTLLSASATAQKTYTTLNGHAHNDYLNKMPFYQAYKAGFGSIEADIFPVNGELFVAHDQDKITKGRTLKSLYLNPVLKELNRDASRRISLLIDIKKNYKAALPILVKQLEPLKKQLLNGQLAIVISGNRPKPADFVDYPEYVSFDDDQSAGYTPRQWQRVGLVSLPFPRLSKWRGEGSIGIEDTNRLRKTIDSVHTAGKRIRFWAAPDNQTAWTALMKLGVDLIGTDKVEELSTFLRTQKEF